MINIQNVTKTFGRKIAVNSINLELKPGEFYAILGPNGAGKTTTIKMITGLLKPSNGKITIYDKDTVSDYIDVKRLVGYIPDEPYVYEKLTGKEFLSFVTRMYKMNGKDLKSEIERLVNTFGMDDYINELTETYSHGMKQRLAIASTLLRKPKVIVVDEPLVGLDPPSCRLVRNIFREQANNGTTVFMSTHIISFAEELADRVGVMFNGKIVKDGNVSEIKKMTNEDGTLEEAFFKIMEEENKNHE